MNSKQVKDSKKSKPAVVKVSTKKQKMEKEEPEVEVEVVTEQNNEATSKQDTQAKTQKMPKKDKNQKESKETIKSNESTKSSKESKKTEEKHLEKTEKDEQPQEESSEQLKFENELNTIREEMKNVKEKLHTLSSSLKSLESAYNHDMRRVAKTTKRRVKVKKTGFAKQKLVPDKLADFIKVARGTEMSGPEITKNVWKQLQERNLCTADDKRVFRTNKEVTELFGVPTSVNKCKDYKDRVNGFNFYNLQRYIKNAYPREEAE